MIYDYESVGSQKTTKSIKSLEVFEKLNLVSILEVPNRLLYHINITNSNRNVIVSYIKKILFFFITHYCECNIVWTFEGITARVMTTKPKFEYYVKITRNKSLNSVHRHYEKY